MQGRWIVLALFLVCPTVCSQSRAETEALRRELKEQVDLEIFRAMTDLRQKLHRTIDAALDGKALAAPKSPRANAPSGRAESDPDAVPVELSRLRDEAPAIVPLVEGLLWRPESGASPQSEAPLAFDECFSDAGWGVTTTRLDGPVEGALGLAAGVGRRVLEIRPGSPFAGLVAVGDVLLRARLAPGGEDGVATWRVAVLSTESKQLRTVAVQVPSVAQKAPVPVSDAERKAQAERMVQDTIRKVLKGSGPLLPTGGKQPGPETGPEKR